MGGAGTQKSELIPQFVDSNNDFLSFHQYNSESPFANNDRKHSFINLHYKIGYDEENKLDNNRNKYNS